MYGTEIKFVDTSKECIQMMKKLSKDAFKKCGKEINEKIKEKIPIKRGYFQKSIKAWAKVDNKTGDPYLDVGYLSRSQMRKKYGIKFFVNATWFEFGTKPHSIQTLQLRNGGKLTYELHDNNAKYGYLVSHPGMTNKNFLRNTVYDNVDEIHDTLMENLKTLEEYIIEEGMNINIGGDEEID